MGTMTPLGAVGGAMLPPPVGDTAPAPPDKNRLVTPEILFVNQGTTYRQGSAFAGTANPTVVWQQMIDNAPSAMLYFRELEAKDDDIADAIDEVKLSVSKRGWQITAADDSAQAVAAKEFVEGQLKGLPDFDNALSNLMDSPFYGYTVAEMIFDTSMGQASLTDIVDCPQELFCFNDWNYPQIGPLRLKNFYGAMNGVLVPEQKFLIFSSRMRHGNRMGRPILRETYWASWFKRNVLRFWMKYGEKGPGTAVVTHKEGATAQEKQVALQAAEAIANEIAVAVSENFNFVKELLTSARSMDPKTYESLYNVVESKIYRRIVGGTLTSHGSDGGKGTQALGTVHQETKEERSVDLCGKVANIINRQLVRNLVLWNFGPDCPVPTFGYDVADEADLGQQVTVADTLQGMGMEIPKAWAHKTFAIPQPESPDDVLDRPAAPTMQGPIQTPAGSPDKPQFSDLPAAQQEQIERDLRGFDQIFGELRTSALEASKQQIAAIAKGVEAGRG